MTVGLGLGVIDRAYERLVSEGGVGITGSLWSSSTERRALPDCARSGCHRPGKNYARLSPPRTHIPPTVVGPLCDPCYDAIKGDTY